MAKKIDKFEFNKDLDRYVNKVSKSNQRFINLNEFMKKDKKEKIDKINDDYDNETQTELIELKEKKGLGLFFSKFFNAFKNKEENIEKEIDETDDEEYVEEDIEQIETDEDFDEEDQEEKKPKKSRCCFFKKLFGNDDDEQINELNEQNEDLLHDLKAVSVFTKDLLELIPKENLDEFRMDGSLDEFKNILKKNNLLRKKE